MATTNYLATGWSDSIDNANITDIKAVIEQTLAMDDEHGAFWVSINDPEQVLETQKDGTVTFIFSGYIGDQIRAHFDNWSEIEKLYAIFLQEDLEQVRQILSKK